jgi:gas vesicle protein
MLNDAASDTSIQSTSLSGFMAGLITGGFIGAVLALAFAPRAGSDFRRTVAGAARDLGAAASDRYQDASASVGDAVAQLANNARAVRNAAADQVVSGAHEVARFAASTKS